MYIFGLSTDRLREDNNAMVSRLVFWETAFLLWEIEFDAHQV